MKNVTAFKLALILEMLLSIPNQSIAQNTQKLHIGFFLGYWKGHYRRKLEGLAQAPGFVESLNSKTSIQLGFMVKNKSVNGFLQSQRFISVARMSPQMRFAIAVIWTICKKSGIIACQSGQGYEDISRPDQLERYFSALAFRATISWVTLRRETTRALFTQTPKGTTGLTRVFPGN